MPAATHHGQVHTEATTLLHGHDDVDIFCLVAVHDLGILCPVQRLDLITKLGGLLKGQMLHGLFHQRGQPLDDLLFAPLKKQTGGFDIFGVSLWADLPDAGSGTAFDLIEQTGSGPVIED